MHSNSLWCLSFQNNDDSYETEAGQIQRWRIWNEQRQWKPKIPAGWRQVPIELTQPQTRQISINNTLSQKQICRLRPITISVKREVVVRIESQVKAHQAFLPKTNSEAGETDEENARIRERNQGILALHKPFISSTTTPSRQNGKPTKIEDKVSVKSHTKVKVNKVSISDHISQIWNPNATGHLGIFRYGWKSTSPCISPTTKARCHCRCGNRSTCATKCQGQDLAWRICGICTPASVNNLSTTVIYPIFGPRQPLKFWH